MERAGWFEHEPFFACVQGVTRPTPGPDPFGCQRSWNQTQLYILRTLVTKWCLITIQQWKLVRGQSTCQNPILTQSLLLIGAKIPSPVLMFLIRSSSNCHWSAFLTEAILLPSQFDYRLGSWQRKMWDSILAISSFMMTTVMRWLTKLTWEEAVKLCACSAFRSTIVH